MGDAFGSGTIIDARRGLILTNAHVAAPQALGQGVAQDAFDGELDRAPDSIDILVADGRDRPVEPKFKAEVVAADGYLDLAVIRITKTASGAIISPQDLAGLTALKIGNSGTVATGDVVREVGYPGVAASRNATFTQGTIAGTVGDDRLETNRAWFNLDIAQAHGNSGGALVDSSGRLVGVPTRYSPGEDSDRQNQARAIDWARPIIAAVVAGRHYTSPYVHEPTGDEHFNDVATVVPGSQAAIVDGCSARAGQPTPTATAVAYHFNYSGLHDDEDVLFAVADAGGSGGDADPGSDERRRPVPLSLGNQRLRHRHDRSGEPARRWYRLRADHRPRGQLPGGWPGGHQRWLLARLANQHRDHHVDVAPLTHDAHDDGVRRRRSGTRLKPFRSHPATQTGDFDD